MITILGELYSSKNGKQIRKMHSGRRFIGKSDKSLAAEPGIRMQLNAQKKQWALMIRDKEFPVTVRFYIFRMTRRRFDYNNICQQLCDLMVKAGYLPDDDANHFIPSYEPYRVDKNNPRCLIKII